VTATWEAVVPDVPDVPEDPVDDFVELETGAVIEPIELDLEALFGDDAAKVKSVAVKGLPSGLKYKNGWIAGTPTKSGVYATTVTLTTLMGRKLTATLTFVVRKESENIVLVTCDAAKGKVSGPGVYAKGKKVTLKAAANKGYVFAGWYQDDALVSRLSSYVLTMPDDDVVFEAVFVTVAEDRAAIAAHIDALGIDFDAEDKSAAASVLAGVYLEWTVAAEALSETTVKVSGLPSGLKFTAKDIVDKKTGLVSVPANTIYGTPAAPKNGKPSGVQIMVTTAGKTSQAFALVLTVEALPAWSVGTFNGGSEYGLVSLTVANTGKLSGKWLAGGNTWTLSASGFDGHIEADEAEGTDEILYAFLTAKLGSYTDTILVLVTPDGMYGYAGDEFDEALFEATAANWKSGELKATAAKIAKVGALTAQVEGDQPGTVTITFGANGTVKVSGQFQTGTKSGKAVYAKATGSSVLCPIGTDDDGNQVFRLYLYLPAKGAFDGYTDVLDLPWDGTAFVLTADAEAE